MTITEAVLEQMQELPSDKQQMVLEFAKFLVKKAEMEQSRYEELRQEILVGVEAAERGEFVDGEEVFQSLQSKLDQKRHQGS